MLQLELCLREFKVFTFVYLCIMEFNLLSFSSDVAPLALVVTGVPRGTLSFIRVGCLLASTGRHNKLNQSFVLS